MLAYSNIFYVNANEYTYLFMFISYFPKRLLPLQISLTKNEFSDFDLFYYYELINGKGTFCTGINFSKIRGYSLPFANLNVF